MLNDRKEEAFMEDSPKQYYGGALGKAIAQTIAQQKREVPAVDYLSGVARHPTTAVRQSDPYQEIQRFNALLVRHEQSLMGLGKMIEELGQKLLPLVYDGPSEQANKASGEVRSDSPPDSYPRTPLGRELRQLQDQLEAAEKQTQLVMMQVAGLIREVEL